MQVQKPLFTLGKLCATPGALEACEESGIAVITVLRRHVFGDWDALSDRDAAANRPAVQHGYRILRAYTLSQGQRRSIITEEDRSMTTHMLADE